MRPTKGVHLLVPRSRLGSDHALGYFSPRDGRLMFLIPWGEFSIIGTTDTDYKGDPGDVYADAADVDYILDAINVQFPDVHLISAGHYQYICRRAPSVGRGRARDDGVAGLA